VKRVTTSSVLVLALVAGASVAEGHIASGKYRGKINNKANCGPPAFASQCSRGTISVKIRKTDDGKRVTAIGWKRIHMLCDDDGDGNVSDDQVLTDPRTATGSVPPGSNGAFTAQGQNADGSVRFTITGRFGHKRNGDHRVAGTIRERRTYNTQDELDPNGSVGCDSGTLKYAATLPD
jgi:hypothetical protein